MSVSSSHWSQNFSSFHHSELLADSFASIVTKNPQKTYSAILKTSGLLSDQNRTIPKSASISFSKIIQQEKRSQLAQWAGALRYDPSAIKFDRLEKRLNMVVYLKRLITEENKLSLTKKLNYNLPKPLPYAIADFILANKDSYTRFMDYAFENNDKFNLLECSRKLPIQPFETFLLLWTAADSHTIDIKSD